LSMSSIEEATLRYIALFQRDQQRTTCLRTFPVAEPDDVFRHARQGFSIPTD
jgi:hypothetical protein